MLLTDFYKVGHLFQYPKGTTLVYSNLTPRKSRLDGINKMCFFGLQYFIKEYLIDQFNENFFNRPKEDAIKEYKRRVLSSLGSHLPSYTHIEDLHNLGYLPIEIKALPEGEFVPMKVPVLTIFNTDKKFFWLTNFIESLMSALIWQPCTSATIAHKYKNILEVAGEATGADKDFILWQGHDFSFRGMSSLESAILSGMGHLTSFYGTDTIPAIEALEYYYGADSEKEIIGGSVPATEHSVMCSGNKDSEIETFDRLITEIYPSGIVSIVSDTWDLWKVCTEYLPILKDKIMSREGKVVIRPDSGDPVEIICGTVQPYDENFKSQSPQDKGVIELLWDVFGGHINEKGYRVLDSHIGAIYGDSITLERAESICLRLKEKGFCSSNIVFGIGSYTYQYNTRDTFGIAMKATYIEIGEEPRDIFKSPVTDDGTKVSAKGLLSVQKENGEYKLYDELSYDGESSGELKTVFRNGKLIRETTLQEIRERIIKYNLTFFKPPIQFYE